MKEESKYKNKNGKEVDVEVMVNTRPNLRDGTHEMMLYSGRHFLENIFDAKKIDEKTKDVWFYYPETWANIPELQALVDFTFYFYPNIEKLRITTHSVYIVQTVRSEHMLVDNGKDLYPQTGKVMDHFSPPPKPFEGLHVLKPS